MISRKKVIGTSVLAGSSLLFSNENNTQINIPKKAKRVVFLCSSLGYLKQQFYPKSNSPTDSYYLNCFEKHQQQFTLFSGLSHPGLLGSLHQSERCFLTAAQNASSPTFKNSISIDQVMAKQIGAKTRFPYLNLGLGDRGIVHNQAGVMIPPMTNANDLYNMMFLQKSDAVLKEEKKQLLLKKKVILSSLKKDLHHHDVTQSFEKSAHLLNQSFDRKIAWLGRPLPKIEEHLPHTQTHDSELLKRYENFLTAIRLAFATDSTRIATLHIPFYNLVPKIEGIDTSWHRLTHMQNKKDKKEQLISIEKRLLALISNFIQDLKDTPTENGNLLDETIIVSGSNLGESSNHNPLNLPIFVAGGKFNHGNYVKNSSKENTPLSQLYLSVANSVEGVSINQFKKESSCLKEFV